MAQPYAYVPIPNYSLSKVLDGVFRIYQKHVIPILSIYGAYVVVIITTATLIVEGLALDKRIEEFLLDLILQGGELTPDLMELLDWIPVIIIGTIASVFWGMFQWIPDSIMVRFVSNFEEQREEDAVSSILYTAGRWPHLIFYFIVLLGVYILLLSAGALASYLLAVISPFTLILSIPTVIFFLFYVYLRLVLVTPLILIEGIGVSEAMKKSWDLMNKRMLTFFGASIAVSIVASMINSFTSQIGGLFPSVGTFVMVLTYLLPSLITGPLRILTGVSAYYLIKIDTDPNYQTNIFEQEQLNRYHFYQPPPGSLGP